MMKNMTSVLDFGSSKITILVGTGDVNKSFKLLASVDKDYEGFSRGEFVDSNTLRPVIAEAINEIENDLMCKIDDLYIGVPAEFCFVYDAMLTKTFNKKTKITAKIVDALFLEDDESNPYSTHTVINKSPLFYIVNEDNKTNDPIGVIANKLQIRTSYVLVENGFKLLISGILDSLGIKKYDFLSNTLSESLYILDDNKRNEGAILVDCGYITTSVALSLGSGLKDMRSFSSGGGFITSDLSRLLEIPFEEAESLKRDAILSLKPSGAEYYMTESGKKFTIKNVNEIICSRIDKIIELINKCIDSFEIKLPDYVPIYLTGGGLNYFEGIKEYFRRVFSRRVELIAPRDLMYRKPDLSSSVGLLHMAINL